MEKTPQHVAFIMDGNRRWARAQGKSLFEGHKKGTSCIEPLVDMSARKGIRNVTFWAFSTENWNRSKEEVADLMDVFRAALRDPMLDRLQKNGVRVNIVGDMEGFPDDIQKGAQKIVFDSQENDRITANFGLNYGGRNEIVRGLNRFVKSNRDKILADPTYAITEEDITSHLDTAGQPDIDFLIRTGGEMRTSGAFPWQAVYAELYFPSTLWPDFTPEKYGEALSVFSNRDRRIGK